MSTLNKSDDEYSYIGDKGDIGFIDIDHSKAICTYNPSVESEKFQISVPFPFVNDKPRSGFVGETIYDSVTIKNLTENALDIWSVTIYDSKPEDTFRISLMEPPNANSDEDYIQAFVETSTLDDRMLRTDQPLTVWLSCKPKDIGLHSAAVHFTIGDETIERLLFVLAEDKISKSLSSARPYCNSRKKKINVVDVHTAGVQFVAGRRPTSNRSSSYRLPDYLIPRDIRDMINDQRIPDVVTEGLSERNYIWFFKNLLAMEEIKLEGDMGAYDMECVAMNGRRGFYLSLEVPGLAERRPSLVTGDYIFAKLASGHGTTDVAYQGYIHRVEAEEVHLMFDQDFHHFHHESNLYNVQFSFNRVHMRKLYQAVDACESLAINFLFPSLHKTELVQPAPLVPISCTLNEEQMSAVEMILSCNGESPYVIHGPPGTGKTVTLIEAILQIYTTSKGSRILVCAPSNSAADHILEGLVAESSANIQAGDVFRLNAYTRPYDDVNPNHIKFCCVENLMFQCPSRSDLQQYKIIISTYTSASLLYSSGVPRGHFSYIFLDEAGQASEPETMIPLSQLHWSRTVVILAGDPMQLGPVLFSKDAESLGLGKSYLERLLQFEPYSSGNRNFMTKLVRNYRTQPEILHLPSELFYDGELIPCKEADSDFLTSLDDLLPNKEFPVLFFGIQGCDEREGSNPSWFNRIEASKVVEIIRLLTEQKGFEEKDIGVITPYRQQVIKIRTALEGLDKSNIKVGSVEQFQGQERQVIIISTVRSTIKHNESDRLHYLGFLSNPKRFNVAVTRARSLLIVIGNPHILCKDAYWNQILWYCVDNSSYKGCFLPERVELSIVSDSIQPSNSQWGPNAGWGDNGQLGEEQNSWEPSSGQLGEEQNNWESSNFQCGEPQNNPENDQSDNNGWEDPIRQWSNGGNSQEPPNNKWGKEKNNSGHFKDQLGEKQNRWVPSKDQQGEEQNNWDASPKDQWGECSSKDQSGKEQNNWDASSKDQLGEEQNTRMASSKDQWDEEQNTWDASSKGQWGEEPNSWESSKGQEQNNWEPRKNQGGKEQWGQEPSKDEWGGPENGTWKPSNHQGDKGKSGGPSNGEWGTEGKTREQSYGQRGDKGKSEWPSNGERGAKGKKREQSYGQRGDKGKNKGKSEWPSNGEWGAERKTREQSYGQQGNKGKSEWPSNGEWGAEGKTREQSYCQQGNTGRSEWQSNGEWGAEGKTREQSYGQRGNKGRSEWPSNGEWGAEGKTREQSYGQRGNKGKSEWPSNGEWGAEGKKTREQSYGQRGNKGKSEWPSNGEWGAEGKKTREQSYGQRGNKGKSKWPSNGEWVAKGMTREQSYDPQGDKGKSEWPSNGEWDAEGKTSEKSYGRRGNKGKSKWPSNVEWGAEGKTSEQSYGPQGDNGKNEWPSNDEWGAEGKTSEQSYGPQGDKGKSEWPSNGEWGAEGKTSEQSYGQQDDKGKSEWPSNGEWGTEGKTREQSYGQQGAKQRYSRSSKAQRGKGGGNGNATSGVKAGVDEISDQLSNLNSGGRWQDITPTGWEL